VRWIIGDVHGCARELEALVEAIRFDGGRDELWCLGDLVNRGPDSLRVLRLWRELGGRSLLGNHDAHAVLAWARRRPLKDGDTLDELFAAPDAAELLAALRDLPVLAQLPGEAGARVPPVWLVHAGLHPRWRDLDEIARQVNAGPRDERALEHPDLAFATRVRCCTADGQRSGHTGPPADCPAPFRPWDEFYAGDTLVIHGHWAHRGRYRGPRTMGLDSGCVHGGKLSAWCHEEDRLVQVPARAG
jgi:bis(5'-nucleosyl)-tetraphosphatase (symmetrical)